MTNETAIETKQIEDSEFLQMQDEITSHQNSFEQELNRTIDFFLDPIVILDKKGTFLALNSEVEKQIHYTKQELIGKNFLSFNLTSPESKKLILKNLMKRFLGFHVDPYQVELITKEGEKRWYEINARIIKYQDKKADFIIFQNIHQKKILEKKHQETKELMKKILDNVQAAVVLIEGTTHNILQVNNFAEELLGYPKEHLIGKTCFQFLCTRKDGTCPITDDKQECIEKIQELVTPDGEKRIILKMVNGFYLENKHYIIDSFVDITELKEKEYALKQTTDTIKKITTAALDGIIIMNEGGNIIFWNPSAEKIFGYSKDEVIGKQLHSLLAPKRYHNDFQQGFENFKITGSGAAIDKTTSLHALKKDGSEISIELSLSSIKSDDSWHAIGIIRDITLREKDEQELKERTNQLERFSRIAVQRELRMKELKQELQSLKKNNIPK